MTRPSLERRRLLRSGLLLAGSGLAAGEAAELPPTMRTPGRSFSNYGQPAEAERGVVRWIAANRAAPGNGVSWTPLHDLEGIITPSGLHFERHQNGVPTIDPATHRLLVDGLVRQPLSFGIDDLLRYPQRSRILFIECGGNSSSGWHREPQQAPTGFLHGLASCSEWTGVPLSRLLDEAGVDASAGWIVAEGADAAAMQVSLPLAKARQDGLLALYQNGERIRPENGYPLRLVVAGCEGVLNVKWLRRLEVAREPAMTRNETARYTELQPDGRARAFTFVMDPKSVITSPTVGQALSGPGVYEIRGLAWSGHGRIRRVDVSADAGLSWAEATLQDPVLPLAFTRFRIPWRWRGKPAVLKCRATDEMGNVQPERERLVAQRGRNGEFHYNAIVAFAVDADGEVTHVYR
ncbi:MAG TPA: sulfite dehydrogenase [Burkholderiaceae bacterium]|nr:sulfite dehydrogenase [Burkholderiaceae bacterium]